MHFNFTWAYSNGLWTNIEYLRNKIISFWQSGHWMLKKIIFTSPISFPWQIPFSRHWFSCFWHCLWPLKQSSQTSLLSSLHSLSAVHKFWPVKIFGSWKVQCFYYSDCLKRNWSKIEQISIVFKKLPAVQICIICIFDE